MIYQAAARHLLDEGCAVDVGVVTMRTMTSDVLQPLAPLLAPEWQEAQDLYEVCLRFVLSDSRVHAAITGMRRPDKVDRNVALAELITGDADLAELPRMTADVYRAEDEDRQAGRA